MHRTAIAALAASIAGAPALASEPVAPELYVSGFTAPLDFVQSTVDDDVQYIVQQNGVIRVIQEGELVAEPFLDLSSRVTATGERGLLGMALDPDFAENGRFYVNYTKSGEDLGDTRIARYTLSDAGPGFDQLSADFDSEEIVMAIEQDLQNHNGGCMRIGPDGYLYIGMGDGGVGSNAQNRATLLGKFLRIDISTPAGYDVPDDNPYVGHASFHEEIWAYGVRNPWRFTFDDFGPCASNGIFIGDVGNFAREEISHGPDGAGGRNYGWRCREGTTGSACSPPAGETFVEPIFDYATGSFGRAVTGSYVYRGAEMAHNRGRYFFSDFVSGRVASFVVDFDAQGEGVVSDYIDHSAAFSGVPSISAFGRDADGELYVLSFNGSIYRVRGTYALGDVNQDDNVGSDDLAVFLAAWGSDDCSVSDLNNDGVVGSNDLAILLAAWGPQD